MANNSILAAFERMWQHIVMKISNELESVTAYTDAEVAKRAQVQIITWEADD